MIFLKIECNQQCMRSLKKLFGDVLHTVLSNVESRLVFVPIIAETTIYCLYDQTNMVRIIS